MSSIRAGRSTPTLSSLVALAALVVASLASLTIWLWSRWAEPLASACQEACNSLAVPLTWLQIAPVAGATLLCTLGFASLVLAAATASRQIALSRQLGHATAEAQDRWPAKLKSAIGQLRFAARVVYLNDPELYAFCHGYLRPVVYVSAGLVASLSPSELRAVLAHEIEHARRRDPLHLLLGRIIARALFFLPIATEMQHRLAVAAEINADDGAAKEVGVPPLASALRKMALSGSRPSTLSPAVGGLDAVRERVRHLSVGGSHSLPGLSIRATVVSALVALAILAVGLGGAAAPIVAATHQPPCCSAAGQHNPSGLRAEALQAQRLSTAKERSPHCSLPPDGSGQSATVSTDTCQ